MRLKWIALCCFLGFIIVLDPTHTPAQFGQKGDGGGGKGGKGGKGGGRDPFGGGGFPNQAGGSGFPAPDGAVVVAPGGGFPQPGGGGFPAGGGGNREFKSSGFPTQGGGGGFPGGGGGGGPRGGDPSAMWDRISQGKDSINLNDPMNGWMKSMMERQGQPVPSDGIITKQMFLAYRAGGGSPGGAPGGATFVTLGSSGSAPGGTMSLSMTPDGRMNLSPQGGGDRDRGAERLREQDKDGDGRVSRAEADRMLQPNFEKLDRDGDGFVTLEEYRGYYAAQQGGGNNRGNGGDMNWSGGGGGWGDPNAWNRQDPRRDAEEIKPVAMRYGHLPKDLPEWFDTYDTNKDGQIALHEWRKAGESIESFNEKDLNGDQLITADELLRFNRQKSEAERIAAIQDGTATTRPAFAGSSRGGPGGKGPGGPPMGVSLPGASLDPAASGPVGKLSERGPGGKGGDKEIKNSDSPPGSNGPWGKKGKN